MLLAFGLSECCSGVLAGNLVYSAQVFCDDVLLLSLSDKFLLLRLLLSGRFIYFVCTQLHESLYRQYRSGRITPQDIVDICYQKGIKMTEQDLLDLMDRL